MYEVDDKDFVREITDLRQCDVGAPAPMVLAGEHDVFLAYYLQGKLEEKNDYQSFYDVAIVKFKGCYAHMFGPPNDEAFHGHPLSSRGLHPCGVFEIKESSWLRKLERMNSVHPYHNKERFIGRFHHFIFSFHDTTFECIAESFDIVIKRGSIKSMIPHMLESIR